MGKTPRWKLAERQGNTPASPPHYNPKGEQMNNREQSWWFETKNINGVVREFIFTKLSNGSIYFRPTRDDQGHPLSVGEFFGQAGVIDRMFRNSDNITQDMKLNEDNQKLRDLAFSKAIPTPNTTNE